MTVTSMDRAKVEQWAKTDSQNGYVVHVVAFDMGDTTYYRTTDWYDDGVVASYENGNKIGY